MALVILEPVYVFVLFVTIRFRAFEQHWTSRWRTTWRCGWWSTPLIFIFFLGTSGFPLGRWIRSRRNKGRRTRTRCWRTLRTTASLRTTISQFTVHRTPRFREITQVVARSRVRGGSPPLASTLRCPCIEIAGRRVAEPRWCPIMTSAI